jgi:hypothetical protein
MGILNLKYITSSKKADIAGFKEVRKFEDCISCNSSEWTRWIAGPYLYENEDFLPRYYFVKNSILVIGEDGQAQETIYIILLDKNFNPENTVIIQGKNKINVHDIDFLKKFNILILLQNSVDQDSLPLLQQYKDSGGKIFPDILDNKNSLDISEISTVLKSFDGELIEADSNKISPNEIEVIAENEGFLVLSEKFAMFEGWSAEKESDNVDILKADAVISSVYVDSPGTIRFSYKPKSFGLGLMITIATLLIIFIYGLFSLRKSLKSKTTNQE